ncbi:MAG TPA: hypothetical protein VLC91_16320 [Spongiibacteraceae bacterium]|nr:hypothetical protein [Spongiibacteraceae bacterium]
MASLTARVSLTALAVLTTPVSQSATAAEPAAANAPDLTRMQQQTDLMHKQMLAIQQAKTPEERQRLMQEHMQTVREHMHTACAGDGMMGYGGPEKNRAGMQDHCMGVRSDAPPKSK